MGTKASLKDLRCEKPVLRIRGVRLWCWPSCDQDQELLGVPIMKPAVSVGPPSGLLLVLMCFPLLGLVQSASSNKARDNGHQHLSDPDPERCMRHHFVETITHPIYKCNSKVKPRETRVSSMHFYRDTFTNSSEGSGKPLDPHEVYSVWAHLVPLKWTGARFPQ